MIKNLFCISRLGIPSWNIWGWPCSRLGKPDTSSIILEQSVFLVAFYHRADWFASYDALDAAFRLKVKNYDG
jgi:hypothetical protein